MKKLMLFICIILIYFSCNKKESQSPQEQLKQECEKQLLQQLKDPSSYQRIYVSITDSVKMSKQINDNVALLWNQESVKLGVVKQNEVDSVLNLLKYYKQNPDKDTTAYIIVEFKYRAKNSYGALGIENTTMYYLTKIPPSGNRYFIYK